MAKLAINGGVQEVERKYQNFIHPKISEKFYNKLNNIDYRNQVSSFDSPIIAAFQEKARKYYGLKHILPTNSGTSALFEMFYAIGLQRNDEVIVPVYTFFATATPLFVLGCVPILTDCLDNGNIDPEDIKIKITPRTKAIVITHMWGIPCDMDQIMEISKTYKIPILEDSSHAHGALYKGKMVGAFGQCSAWSLGAKKLITGGQGGMLGTNNDEIYQKAVLFGHANNKRIKDITLGNLFPYAISGVGLNLRMHPFSAALITDQLDNYKNQVKEKDEIARYLTNEIKKIPGLKLPRIPDNSRPAWYAFPIIYDSAYFNNISRDRFVEALIAEGATGFDIPHTTSPLTAFDIFNERGVHFDRTREIKRYYSKSDFVNAERFHGSIFKLPVWYGNEKMEYAESHVSALKKVVKNIKEIFS